MFSMKKVMKIIVMLSLYWGSAYGTTTINEKAVYRQIMAKTRNTQLISQIENYLASNENETRLSQARKSLNHLKEYFLSKNYRQAKMVKSLLENEGPSTVEVEKFIDHIQNNQQMAISVKSYVLSELTRILENLQPPTTSLRAIDILAAIASEPVQKTTKARAETIRAVEAKNSESKTSFQTYFMWIISLIVMYFAFKFSFTYKWLKLKGEQVETLKLTSSKENNWYQKTKSISLAKMDHQGKILACNDVFKQEFSSKIEAYGNWDDFFMNSFYKDEALKGIRRLFKYTRDLKNDYFVHSRLNSKAGVRFVEIFKMDTRELALLGNKRKIDLEKESINSLDVFENVLAGKSNVSGHCLVDYPQLKNDNGYLLYMDPEAAEILFEKVISFFDVCLKTLGVTDSLSPVMSRDQNNFNILLLIRNVKIADTDMNGNVDYFGQKTNILKMMNEMETVVPNLGIKTVFKNFSDQNEVYSQVHIIVKDSEYKKWYQKTIKIRKQIDA